MELAPQILVVDDSADTLYLIAAFLRGRGYRVVTAIDGLTGMALAVEHRPELVVTDMLMPGASGFRVLDRLKSDPVWKPAVIMISANDAPLHRAYAGAMGADDFLPKPFVLQQLLDSVRRLCPMATEPSDGVELPPADAQIVT